MSRASAVRDAVLAALAAELPGETVEAFIIPQYTREEIADGRRIAVRFGSRELSVNQGPDERNVSIEVAVVGLVPGFDSDSPGDFRTQQVAAVDELDGVVESIIALWTPGGALRRKGMAEHSFVEIEHPVNFDPRKLYDEGIFLSVLVVNYEDSVDD